MRDQQPLQMQACGQAMLCEQFKPVSGLEKRAMIAGLLCGLFTYGCPKFGEVIKAVDDHGLLSVCSIYRWL